MMVQTTHFANFNNVAFYGHLCSSRLRGVFAERQVSAPVMVIRRIQGKCAVQGAFAEDDHMIQTLAPNGADEPLHIGPLPGRAWRRQHLFDSRRFHLLNELMPENPISVAQQIARRFVPRKGLTKLLGGLLRSRTFRHAEMDNAPIRVFWRHTHFGRHRKVEWRLIDRHATALLLFRLASRTSSSTARQSDRRSYHSLRLDHGAQ